MKRETLWQTLKYTLFSVSAGIIQAGTFALLTYVVFRGRSDLFWLCNLIALVCSVIWNFTLNRKYTFQATNNIPVAMLKIAAFYLVFTPVSSWLGQLMVSAGWYALIVEGLVMISNFVLEFLYYKYIVFKK